MADQPTPEERAEGLMKWLLNAPCSEEFAEQLATEIRAAVAAERERIEALGDDAAFAYRDAMVRNSERERCARVADALYITQPQKAHGFGINDACREIATAIREGEPTPDPAPQPTAPRPPA